MSKKKKVLMMVLAALIGLLLLACAAFYVVFDVPNWQKLDASKPRWHRRPRCMTRRAN